MQRVDRSDAENTVTTKTAYEGKKMLMIKPEEETELRKIAKYVALPREIVSSPQLSCSFSPKIKHETIF